MKALLSTFVTLALMAGCTAKNPAYEKQLTKLNENILILQNERDRLEERIAVLEQQRKESVNRRPEPQQGTLSRPPLKVVQLRPSDVAPVAQGASNNGAAATPSRAAAPNIHAPESSRTLISGSGDELRQSEVPREGE